MIIPLSLNQNYLESVQKSVRFKNLAEWSELLNSEYDMYIRNQSITCLRADDIDMSLSAIVI
jgi:hypothetical protein